MVRSWRPVCAAAGSGGRGLAGDTEGDIVSRDDSSWLSSTAVRSTSPLGAAGLWQTFVFAPVWMNIRECAVIRYWHYLEVLVNTEILHIKEIGEGQ